MQISILVSQTFSRLAGIRALLELLDKALPESEWREAEALKQIAEGQNWDFSDFQVERDALNERFRFWLPRFTAYSVITLLYTVLETQLASAAKLIQVQKQLPSRPSDVRGRGVEASASYLTTAGVYDVQRDFSWQTICNIRDLRHLIIHQAGTKGQLEKNGKIAQHLTSAYPCRIEFPNREWYGEVWISIPLCREFIATVEAFFDRLFDAMGLPPRFKAGASRDPG